MNIVDIIILAILGLSLVSGMYKGFITSTLALVGFCGAWIASLASYQYLVKAVTANESLMKFFSGLVGAVDLFKTTSLANMQVASATTANIDQAVSEINIPLISNLFRDNVVGKVFANEGLSTMSEYLTQTLLTTALNIICFLLMFIVIYAAVLLIVNMLNNVFRFPALRHLDWLLGGVFGLVRGLVIVMLIFAVVPTISSALSSMNITMLTELIDASRIGKIFQDSNFVANTLQSILS
ncbi:MAG: CvpA family protein [Clostridia bacterium]|nr:CvpA family protein [Clostridia bacterium]